MDLTTSHSNLYLGGEWVSKVEAAGVGAEWVWVEERMPRHGWATREYRQNERTDGGERRGEETREDEREIERAQRSHSLLPSFLPWVDCVQSTLNGTHWADQRRCASVTAGTDERRGERGRLAQYYVHTYALGLGGPGHNGRRTGAMDRAGGVARERRGRASDERHTHTLDTHIRTHTHIHNTRTRAHTRTYTHTHNTTTLWWSRLVVMMVGSGGCGWVCEQAPG